MILGLQNIVLLLIGVLKLNMKQGEVDVLGEME